MTKIKLFGVFCVFSVLLGHAQRDEIKGQLIAPDDVEGIHILNKTAAKYAISDEEGKFVIIATVNDTLYISSLKYEAKEVVVSAINKREKQLTIALTEKINALNQVFVGSMLTGRLQSDLANSDAKTEINFYDLGIPGNTKLPLTQNERKLFDADGGSWGSIGLGASVNFHKLLNAISGRTKKLKGIVALDDKDKCINRLRSAYESILFENDSLDTSLRNEYFLFAQEDPSFLGLCKSNNEIVLLEFLQDKLKAYQKNRESAKND